MEVHEHSEHEFGRIPDLASLDALLLGIAHGGLEHLFDKTVEIRSIPSSLLIHRPGDIGRRAQGAEEVEDEAEDYIEHVVEATLAEVESIHGKGNAESRREK